MQGACWLIYAWWLCCALACDWCLKLQSPPDDHTHAMLSIFSAYLPQDLLLTLCIMHVTTSIPVRSIRQRQWLNRRLTDIDGGCWICIIIIKWLLFIDFLFIMAHPRQLCVKPHRGSIVDHQGYAAWQWQQHNGYDHHCCRTPRDPASKPPWKQFAEYGGGEGSKGSQGCSCSQAHLHPDNTWLRLFSMLWKCNHVWKQNKTQ